MEGKDRLMDRVIREIHEEDVKGRISLEEFQGKIAEAMREHPGAFNEIGAAWHVLREMCGWHAGTQPGLELEHVALNTRAVVNPEAGRPCETLPGCPYGALVELFPLEDPGGAWSCPVFGHNCPVYYVAEPLDGEELDGEELGGG